MSTKEPQPQIQPPKSSSTSTPPVNISTQAYLDPACYVKGIHALTIEPNVVIHPRCRLYTDQGKITIHTGTILTERCIVGFDKDLNPPNDTSTQNTTTTAITIGPNAHLATSVKIQPPATISDSSIIEAGVTLLSGCVIGAHSKVCAGITLPAGTIVPEWTVVYGPGGRLRRKRERHVTEDIRLEGLARERAGMDVLLRASAAKTLGSTSGGSRSHVKRDSILKTPGA